MGSLEAAGARLKELRIAAGMTQQDLAAKAGVSYFTISKIEQGKTKLPSTTVLYKLATALQFDIDQLLDTTQPKLAKPQIKFVYSDIGGVLVHTESQLFHHLSNDLNRSLEQIKAIYYQYVPVACRGNLGLRDLQMLMLLKLKLKYKSANRHKLFRHWVDYMSPIPEMNAFLTQIAKNSPVGLLTDTIDGFVERMQKQNLLPKLKYKAIIKSSDVGITKPNREIYAIATKRSGASPKQILFIDDKRINVKGARAFGWHAEWFDEMNPKQSVARIARKYF